jgi:tRNA (guanine-N7-)-methyltransferase
VSSVYRDGRAGLPPEEPADDASLLATVAEHDDGAVAHAHIRSFVLRQGHLSAAQKRFHTEQMPRYGVPYAVQPLDFVALFGRAAPKVLEIGCGMGDTTAEIAAAHPDINYLGIEVHTPGVGNLCKHIAERGLTNLRICQHDAVEVIRDMVGAASLDGIHVFFPDPWHKKRHHKRRLIQGPFVAELAARLQPGGYLHCATDWEEYAQQMVEVLAAEPLLENTVPAAPGGFAPRPAYRPVTRFEQRGLKLGHGVWDIVFRRRLS